MNFKLDKTLLKYCVYFAVTVIAIYIALGIINNMGGIIKQVYYYISSGISLLKPLLIALVITYILYPGVKYIEAFLEKKKVFKKQSSRRALGIVTMYILITGLIIGIIYGIFTMIGGQVSRNETISSIFYYIVDHLKNTSLSADIIQQKLQSYNIPMSDTLNNSIVAIINRIQSVISVGIASLANSIISIGSNMFVFFIGIILSIYLLNDTEYFINIWSKFFRIVFKDSKIGVGIKYVFSVFDGIFSKYLRGQLLEAGIVGILSALLLSIIGIDYAVLIGIISGICNLIPYVGPLVGTVLATIIGLLSGNPLSALWAMLAMLVVQQLDNNLLAPKIVGDSVGLHPLFTMISILIGGNIGGLAGMLLAVPVAASIQTMIVHWYSNNYEKENMQNE